MTNKGAMKLNDGLYVLRWKGGGASLAAVGRNERGDVWYAPTNWISVPGYDWGLVDGAEMVCWYLEKDMSHALRYEPTDGPFGIRVCNDWGLEADVPATIPAGEWDDKVRALQAELGTPLGGE